MGETSLEQLHKIAGFMGMEVHGEVDFLVAQPGHKGGGLVVGNDRGGSSLWNPWTDNGDAFLLALNFQISVWRDDDILYIGRGQAIHLKPEHDASAVARIGICNEAMRQIKTV